MTDFLDSPEGQSAVEEIYGDINCACDRGCVTDILRRAAPFLSAYYRKREREQCIALVEQVPQPDGLALGIDNTGDMFSETIEAVLRVLRGTP